MLGMTAVAVVGGAREVEDGPALSVFAASLPDAQLTPVALGVERTPDGATVTGWPDLERRPVDPAPARRSVQLPPRRLPRPRQRRPLRRRRPAAGRRRRGVGGAGPGRQPSRARRAGHRPTGAVGVFLEGFPVRTVVSQGCRPVGQPFVVTRGEGNRIDELAGKPGDRTRAGLRAAARREEDRTLMRAGCTSASWSTSTRPTSSAATSSSATCSAATRRPARSWSATTSPSVRRCSSTCATLQPPTRTSARCSTGVDGRRHSCSRATAGAAACSAIPDHDAGRGRPAPRAAPDRGRVLRGRDRPGRRPQRAPRVHRQPRGVLSRASHPPHEPALHCGHAPDVESHAPRRRAGRGGAPRRVRRR